MDTIQAGGLGRDDRAVVAELMETILRTRPHPEHGYRACSH